MLASGLASGPAAELAAVVKDTGIRILGPNTAGHISTPANFTSSFFPLGEIPAGPISYIAQTGNFTGAMMRHIMTAENYGVARCIGLGNAVDIDEADVLEYLAGDDRNDRTDYRPDIAAKILQWRWRP